MSQASHPHSLNLAVGDWVVVKSAEEIRATLDANARYEELPFMPQMLQYCGKKLRVRKRAHKLCDTVNGTGGRELNDAVFLDELRCMGEAYGGCEMRCTLIWKEIWLRRADASSPEIASPPSPDLEALVAFGTRHPSSATSAEPIYVCQATQLPIATRHLPWWKPRQYLEDYRSGNATLGQIATRVGFLFYSKLAQSGLGFGTPLRWLYTQLVRPLGEEYPVRPGHHQIGGPTPTVNLGLKVGDTVRVKRSDDLLATLDEQLSNRGMSFHAEMMPFCGKTFKVAQRVEKLINEKTGKLHQLKNSCLVLDGADCHGRFAQPLNCPRACPPYWREIWLERVEEGSSQLPADKHG